MAGLWQRTTLIVKSKYSKLLNRAENPTETLDYSYEQMLEQLQNVKRGVADVVTSKKRIELQQQKLEQNVVKLETQARQAVAANREDLATQALERKAVAQQQLQDMDGQVKQLEDQQEKLIAAQQQLETRIESFRSQKEILKAQYSAAEAQVKVGEAATGIGQHMQDTGLAIQRAKDKTEEMQARASAIDELTSTGALEDFTAGDQTQLDRELSQISTASQVDDELAKLKAEVGSGAPPKEIAAGDRARATDEQPAAEAEPAPRLPRPRAPSRRLSRPRKPPSPDPVRRHPLRPQEAARSRRPRGCSRSRPRPSRSRPSARSRRPATSALIFKPLSAGEFTSTESDAEELLRGVAKGSGSTIDRKTDSFGFEWVIVRDPSSTTRSPASTRSRRSSRSTASAASSSPPRSASTAAFGRRPSRLLDLRLQDRNVVAVRPDRREAGARQRAGARAEGEARARSSRSSPISASGSRCSTLPFKSQCSTSKSSRT